MVKTKDKKRVICLIGESGSGKDYIASILNICYGLIPLKSYTTRKPRYKDENTHIFISNSEVENYPNKIAITLFDNNVYFATSEQLDKSDVYIIDVNGVNYLKSHYNGNKEVITIYLKTSRSRRFIRLCKRDGFLKAIHRIRHDTYAFRNVYDVADYIVSNNGNPYWAAITITELFYNLIKGDDLDKYKNKKR